MLDKQEPLNMFLRAIKRVECAVMTKEQEEVHHPVCYTSQLLSHKESGFYPSRKLILTLASGCRRMQPFLYQHPIIVVTTSPIELARRTISSITEIYELLGEFDDLKFDFTLKKA